MPKITPTHWTVPEKIFLLDGWQFDRQEGSRRSYVKPGVARLIVIPAYHSVPVSIIRSNMRTANMSRERYFALLSQV
ncbi:MAG: type II toxin-antitoxin system HicA family toxin [Candidatus Rokubacteria bacterium]|nr:type II toxin-antitoxin system HicA family toxin [Candidatus Rokubacteria bacterium]